MYLLNKCLNKRLDKNTPFEVFNGKRSFVKYMRVFSSVCYAHIPLQQRQKPERSSNNCVFMGVWHKWERLHDLYLINSKDKPIKGHYLLWRLHMELENKCRKERQCLSTTYLNNREIRQPRVDSIHEESQKTVGHKWYHN